MDLDKLSPAPWRVGEEGDDGYFSIVDANGHQVSGASRFCGELRIALAKRICLWRNAEEIMMRRGWTACPSLEGWFVDSGRAGCMAGVFEQWLRGMRWPTPFQAIVAAEEWYVANEKGGA